VVMEHAVANRTTFQELAALGVCLAIDDFGTGYSSLAYLKRFPVQTLKLDRSFLEGALSDEMTASLVRAVVALGKSLKLRVVVEGVETEEMLLFCEDAGCDAVQGYFYARPFPAAGIRGWLEEPAGEVPARKAPGFSWKLGTAR
ncbi:MAG: EAL domain-containing protein, partial [Deinococcus sp.]